MSETLRCPICGKLFDPESSRTLPFCSLRCKKIDLARWLGEEYGLPYEADESADPPDDEPPKR